MLLIENCALSLASVSEEICVLKSEYYLFVAAYEVWEISIKILVRQNATGLQLQETLNCEAVQKHVKFKKRDWIW